MSVVADSGVRPMDRCRFCGLLAWPTGFVFTEDEGFALFLIVVEGCLLTSAVFCAFLSFTRKSGIPLGVAGGTLAGLMIALIFASHH